MFQTAQRTQPPTGLVAMRTGIWRITQQKIGGEPTFLIVAEESPPTRKTLAASDSLIEPVLQEIAPVTLSDRTTEASPVPRTAPARLRKPVGSVYFAVAVSRLSAAASPIVAAAAASAARTDRLVLTAYTDPHGSLELNRRIADLRAESVTAALGARGVDPAQVIVLSRPQCCARQPLPERDAAPYRRVDIEILTHRALLSDERGDGTQHHS
jgi:outer membrane protein OmpA-like peptidoglycan-associated protein